MEGLRLRSERSAPSAAVRRPRLVVIGNGMAGVRTLEELLKLAPGRYDVAVFGAEPYPNYNRILLSPVLAGELPLSEIVLNDLDWYLARGIRLHLNKQVARIDRGARKVIAEDGTEERYDRLLLATGSTPFLLPVPGNDLEGVLTYRDIRDTNSMILAASHHRAAVVIGGGLLGLEAANGLRARGMDVTVVHLMPWLMERQLDPTAAGMLRAALEARGIRFRLAAQTEAILLGHSGRVGAVKLKDEEVIAADLVVMAAGIRPNISLAESAGLLCQRGVVVTDTMQTFDPRIYAVGECVAHRGVTYGLVAPLYEQARICAMHLAECGPGRYQGSVVSTQLKVTGIDLFSAGDFMGGAGTEAITLNDVGSGIYRKVVLKNNQVAGAVLYGDTEGAAWLLGLMREKRDVTAIRDALAFGPEAVAMLKSEEGLSVALSPAETVAAERRVA